MPAYAASIHKSQGSEYPAVVIPLMTQHYAMLQRNLLYTGVTRGKRLVVLVGQKKTVAIAVRNVLGRRRWSKLAERLVRTSRSVTWVHELGVTEPPWRSRVYLASGKWGTSQLRRFEHASGMSAIPPIADVSPRRSEPPLRARSGHWPLRISAVRRSAQLYFSVLVGGTTQPQTQPV